MAPKDWRYDVKVLVAYNGLETGLEASCYALDEVARIAKRYGLGGTSDEEDSHQVVVLSVVPPGARRGAQLNFGPHAHEDVAIAHAFLRERGIRSTMKVGYGDPAEEILKEAREGGYDLVVLGRRELGPIGRLALGSVSGKVAKKAPCPVVVASKGRVERIEPVAALR